MKNDNGGRVKTWGVLSFALFLFFGCSLIDKILFLYYLLIELVECT